MSRKRRILIMLVVLILSMGVLTACQSEPPVAPADNPQESDEVISPKAIDGDITVGVSINALDAINNRQVFEMMQKKVADAGYE